MFLFKDFSATVGSNTVRAAFAAKQDGDTIFTYSTTVADDIEATGEYSILLDSNNTDLITVKSAQIV